MIVFATTVTIRLGEWKFRVYYWLFCFPSPIKVMGNFILTKIYHYWIELMNVLRGVSLVMRLAVTEISKEIAFALMGNFDCAVF
jgi:hypothetical protein